MKIARRIASRLVSAAGWELRPSHSLAWLKTRYGVDTIIDVGANVGQFAQLIRSNLPGATIHSFEPIPAAFRELCDAFSDDVGFHAYQVAVGATAKKVAFHVSAFSPSSSVLPMAHLHKQEFPETAAHRDIDVQMVTLDSYMERMRLTDRVLLKMDVQGYEDRVLAGAAEVLTRTVVIIAEVSFAQLYDTQASFADLYSALSNHGFRYNGQLDQLHSQHTHIPLSADVVFVRSDR